MHRVEESGAMPALTSQQQGLVTARASIPCPRSRSNRGPCTRKPNSTWQKSPLAVRQGSSKGTKSWGRDTQGGCQGSVAGRHNSCATHPREEARERGFQHQPQTDMTSLSCHQATAMQKTGCYSRCTMMLRTPLCLSLFRSDPSCGPWTPRCDDTELGMPAVDMSSQLKMIT
ncbi:hypothetical protein J3F83DRAFT_620357 [Trichoderma novae-zelandiae]